MNVICHICGDLVDCIGLQPRGVRICNCKDQMAFLKRRLDALWRENNKLREPERTAVCDILANGAIRQDWKPANENATIADLIQRNQEKQALLQRCASFMYYMTPTPYLKAETILELRKTLEDAL
jgi:hypothetical protein